MDSFQPHLRCLPQTFLFLVLLVASNLLTFYYFSSSPPPTPRSQLPSPAAPLHSERVAAAHLPQEFTAFTSPQPLPFGRNPNLDSDVLRPPVGHPCLLFPDLLSAFLSYPVNGSCPDDELPAQKLLLRGCEPLPRRRCRPAAPPDPAPPHPFPTSLWSSPPDRSVLWTAYSCKNFACLVHRKHSNSFDDCKDCFDLHARERHRWVYIYTTIYTPSPPAYTYIYIYSVPSLINRIIVIYLYLYIYMYR